MTDVTLRSPVSAAHAPPRAHGFNVLHWVTSTNHKTIGLSYIVTSFLFFLLGGVLALFIRSELASSGRDIIGAELYNQFFTMHGSIMIFLFIVPMAFGLANYVVPLQIGAPDMAFPRLNALSYWLYLVGGLTMVTGFVTNGGAADFGWTAYEPLSGPVRTPNLGGDLWITAIALVGTATILGSVNIVTTIAMLRAPGMTMFRMTIFTWNMLVTSLLALLVTPALTALGVMMLAERVFDAKIFDVSFGGDPVMFQHLFWFFGHPEVYIVALPFFGVVSDIFPVFANRPIFGYVGLVFATLAIAGLSLSVWAHHMFATGVVLLPFFSILTMLIAVPTGVKFFNWIGTMWGGQLRFDTPMLFSIGFLFVFLIGGLTGPILAAPALDFAVTDTYFVVAHFHYVLMAIAGFAVYAAIYYWFPKFTGKKLSENLGRVQFVLMFIGVNLTFFPQHFLGLRGMPRRYGDYPADAGFEGLNVLSTVGAFVIGLSILPFMYNVITTMRRREAVGSDPWGAGQTLEWWTSSPPPGHNFDSLPPIHSERPLFDLRYGAPGSGAGPPAGGDSDDGTGHGGGGGGARDPDPSKEPMPT